MTKTQIRRSGAKLDQDRIKVLYIGGYLRVGSTLLDRTLGQVKGFHSVGELRHVWEESFAEDQPCGCGAPFSKCNFWLNVVEEAYGGFDNVNVEDAIWLKRHVDRMRYIPQLISPWKSSEYQERFHRYSRNLSQLYSAVKSVSGGRVIVDSSKDASYAYALNNVPNVDLYIVHLVRDSRAVAHSWLRKKIKHEVDNREIYMDQRGPVGSSVGWMRSNMLVGPLRHCAAGYTTVRYEDFVASPESVLRFIISMLGEDVEELPVTDNQVRLGVDHTVAGNSNRFRRGEIGLKLDEEWKRKMSRTDRGIVAALTWPLLMQYGYFGDKEG